MAYSLLIDIMYQVAKGMCYLHDMQIAHQGLKPDNILVSFKKEKIKNNGKECAFVKTSDFGTSKINVGRTPKRKSNHIIYGTLGYVAPKILQNEDKAMKTCAFEANVFSFAMTCSEILSRKKPFPRIHKREELLKRIKERERLELPSNYNELSELIEECWSFNPSQHPKFGDICDRLASLKTKFLIGFYENKGPSFSSSKKTNHQVIEKKETCGDNEVVKFGIIHVFFV
uniref:Protein kinase domain-containing protein n=1 Tax=Physcomitrium patens TaxID=3218 RepID=A0A7I3Z5Y2_PHYPA